MLVWETLEAKALLSIFVFILYQYSVGMNRERMDNSVPVQIFGTHDIVY